MPFEIEAKLKVESHEPIRARLQELAAEFESECVETDQFLDREDGALRVRGVALRVRAVQPVSGGPTQGVLTVKGPVLPGAVKTREEVEQPIDDPAAVLRMLELLGFTPILTYQKRRETWAYRDCRVCLDAPPHIGLFVEIEGPAVHDVESVRSDLGLDGVPHVRPSYAALLSAYCAEQGIPDRVVLL